MAATTPLPLFDTLAHCLAHAEPGDKHDHCYQEDLRPAWRFLQSYRGSEATFNAYRREIERLLQWSWLICQKPLAEMKRDDIEAFVQFCQQPPAAWISQKKARRYIEQDGVRVPNPAWRPFVAPPGEKHALSPKAVRALLAIVSSFFQFLLDEQHVIINPVAQIRQKTKFMGVNSEPTQIRRLSGLQWGYLLETAEQMASDSPDPHERTLFILNALYGMYLRISELAASDKWLPQMNHFHIDQDGNWWFMTLGKGAKLRQISVSNAMLSALSRYRRWLGLTPLPGPQDNFPLLPKQTGHGAIRSTRHIRAIVQHCFDAACERLRQDGLEDDAQQLAQATVHWLRHTGISEDVKIRPREHVRDDAGHGSGVITDQYIDVILRERHASKKHQVIKPAEFED